MSFFERLKLIENLLTEDTERCITELSSRNFIGSLFYQELKAFVGMFEQVLQRRTVSSKGNNDSKGCLRPQVVVVCYSIIIMRSSLINIKQQHTSAIATKVDQYADSIFNSKLAVQNLSKIYRGLEQNDVMREVVVGLLLKIRGFNNYKMIVKDINPKFISDQTMNLHFQVLKTQCPNLLQTQLLKYKKSWGKYLNYKLVTFQVFQQLLVKAGQIESESNVKKWDQLKQKFESQTTYLLNRFKYIEESRDIEKINIDQITASFDDIYARLFEKLKQTSTAISKGSKNKSEFNPEYDFKQFVHKNYIKMFYHLLVILNKSIVSIGMSWLRKIKWLYNYVMTIFINFTIRNSNFHESISKEYSRVIITLTEIMTNYLVTFKSGLFPIDKLEQIAITEQFSYYKLIQALLYNEYPFDEAEVISFQNYQKQRRFHDTKQKQHVIDVVNFNMKTLNINLHWDSIFIKIIPTLKNSVVFANQLAHSALVFMHKYFQISHNYQNAAKFIFMVANSRNSMISNDKGNKHMIQKIKTLIYPVRSDIREGIEYFCQEYFNEYIKVTSKKWEQKQKESNNRLQHLQYFHLDDITVQSQKQIGNSTFKKTESRQAILQGWQNFESVKDSSIEDLRNSKNKHQEGQIVNSQIFYSIRESKGENKLVNEMRAEMEQEIKVDNQENQILLPEF